MPYMQFLLKNHATDYHRAVEALLSALFYPSLAYPDVEQEIHEGRKRIDISYMNIAQRGFFHWVADHYSAPHIYVECKNYKGDPANPELDQLAGRFRPVVARSDYSCAEKLPRRTFSSNAVGTRP